MALQFLTKIFGGANPIKTIADIADKFITTKQEKAEFEKQMEQVFQAAEQFAQNTVTERHENDMKSDSFLSKNIRPLIFIFCLGMTTIFAFTDGNFGAFQVKPEYIELYKLILGAAVSFYFIGRTIEKVNKIRK